MCTSGRPVSCGRTSRSSRSGGGSGGLAKSFGRKRANLTAVARLAVLVGAAVAIGGVPALLDGPDTRFAPCPGTEEEACARPAGTGAAVRLAYPPGARPVGLPGRVAVVIGTPREGDPAVTGQAALRVAPVSAVPAVLDRLDRPGVVVAGRADAASGLSAAAAPGVDGLVLVDPPADLAPSGPPLEVSALLLVSGAPPRATAGLSVRALVVLRRPGALDPCTRRVLAGFTREPLSPRPDVTDCRG